MEDLEESRGLRMQKDNEAFGFKVTGMMETEDTRNRCKTSGRERHKAASSGTKSSNSSSSSSSNSSSSKSTPT